MTDNKALRDESRFGLVKHNRWTVIRIKEHVQSDSDFSWLKYEVAALCKKGASDIAIAFAKKSYLYSKVISVLVTCSRTVNKHHGNLALVEPEQRIKKMLKTMKLNNVLFSIYDEIGDLPA
ncbi:MAG: hypothetical protein GF398_20815 [Chitinivibrionales bacterium]|nr:hypothetical protein [Chitinivibrionales bacterium]